MIKKLILTALSFLLLIAVSCDKKDNDSPQNPDPVIKDSVYQQYGTPFAGVPDVEDIIMYEVNLRAFSSAGNLQGVINRLDEIAKLKVNVLWLMPIHPVGEVNSVNSPYSVKNYKEVAQEYGTLNDLRRLTDAAHARGMAVMMDWVANHTAWDNPWISNKSWYTQDGSGNIIHPGGTNWMDVADLNYNSSAMRLAMIDAMKYWVYTANVDGFRCDYADGVPFDFWKQAIDSIRSVQNRKFIFFAEGTRNDHFTAGFDLNFGWQFYGALKDVFAGQPVNRIFSAHTTEYASAFVGKHWVRFTTNHDESAWDATPVTLFNGTKGALAASVLAIFTGGVPLIYGSQEVGTAANVPFFSNSSINWSANPEMLSTYQKMLNLYAIEPAARSGQNIIRQHNDVACLEKSLESSKILLIANVRNSNISYTVPLDLRGTQWIDYEGIEQLLPNQLQLEPYQFLLLKK